MKTHGTAYMGFSRPNHFSTLKLEQLSLFLLSFCQLFLITSPNLSHTINCSTVGISNSECCSYSGSRK